MWAYGALIALFSTARAGWDVCSTTASVQPDGEIAPGGWLAVLVTTGDYGDCGAAPTLTPSEGGEPLALESSESSGWGEPRIDWFQIPSDLPPGDYMLSPDGSTYGYTIYVGGTLEIGAPPEIVAAAEGRIRDRSSSGGCAEERALCVDLDASAPGVPGWAIEVTRAENGARTWWMLPSDGAQGGWCLPLSCSPVTEACIDLRPVDPAHTTGDSIGPLCAAIDPEPSTSADTDEDTGCGCAARPGGALPGWVLAAAGGLALLARSRRYAERA